MTDTIIGIDLGTTNSEVAVVRDGHVEVLDITRGVKLLPSYVGVADDGALLLGETAKNQYALHPERTIKSIKRQMGDETKVSMGERDYRPQEVSAMLLRHLKSIAEAQLGTELTRAVITVPAFFNDAQRQATREAGELAGLEVARIINEPTAAALAYEGTQAGRKRILVYDLGGGTFDVSVVKMEDGIVEVLASHGNNHLGGDDFDRVIVDHCLSHLQQSHKVDASSSPQAMARITRASERAKIALSNEPFVRIEEEYLLEHAGKPVNLSLELSRDDYETMIAGFIDETLEAVHTAMSGAGLTVADLDEVLLVGGATRTPLVSRRLESVLSLQPRMDVDPDLCVATGAAIQGAMIAGDSTATVLVDVTPYTFGTGALDEVDGMPYPHCFVPLIRKNTPIPVSKSEVFYTASDNQQTVEVNVYQGEDPDALNNTEIGNFRIEGLRKVPSGNPITATFSLDLDGILQVSSREKNTGLEKSITITGALSGIQEDELQSAREHLDALFADGSAAADSTVVGEAGGRPNAGAADGPSTGAAGNARNRQHTQANALIEKAEHLLDSAGEEDREDLVDQLEAIKEAMQSDSNEPGADGDDKRLEEAMEQLSDLVYYIDA